MAKQDELFLQEHGRKNYWGYSTLSGYFAPEPSYATKAAQEKGAAAVRQEVIDMVRALHEAGFEVIMDVVYNHTCEGGVEGADGLLARPRRPGLLSPSKIQYRPTRRHHRLRQYAGLHQHACGHLCHRLVTDTGPGVSA